MGARVNLGAFYLAGIPMAVLLAFVAHLNGMVLKFFKIFSQHFDNVAVFSVFFSMTLLELRQLHGGNAP
jgi:hypothetical protein